jgi:hypothetical protein
MGVLRGAANALRWAAGRLPEDHPLRRLVADLAEDLCEALRAAPKPGETWRGGAAE